MAKLDGLTLRPMTNDPADFDRFARCFAENDAPKDLDHLRWQYLDRPGGKPLADVAVAEVEGEEVFAAIYATFPSRFVVDGALTVACQSLDTMTDRRFRKRGLFRELATRLYARLADDGYALVYGFPNSQSVHGFKKYLGWSIDAPAPFLVRPLRTGLVARRFLGEKAGMLDLPLPAGLGVRRLDTVSRSHTFDERFDTLWEQTRLTVRSGLVRDAAYLAWRFDRNPRFDYETMVATRGHDLLGFVTYRVADKHGGRLGYVMELAEAPGSAVAAPLLAEALRAMRAAGTEMAMAWSLPGTVTHGTLRRLGFLSLPERVRPIELHFGCAPLARPRPHPASWFISYSDSDTV